METIAGLICPHLFEGDTKFGGEISHENQTEKSIEIFGYGRPVNLLCPLSTATFFIHPLLRKPEHARRRH